MPGKTETNAAATTTSTTTTADAVERTTQEGETEPEGSEGSEGSVVAATFVRPPPLQQQEGEGFNELGPGPPGLLQLQPQRSKKWERSPADNVLDVEEKLAAMIPSFDSTDKVVTGLITMEDVIEELLQVRNPVSRLSEDCFHRSMITIICMHLNPKTLKTPHCTKPSASPSASFS